VEFFTYVIFVSNCSVTTPIITNSFSFSLLFHINDTEIYAAYRVTNSVNNLFFKGWKSWHSPSVLMTGLSSYMTSLLYAVNCFKLKRQSNITPQWSSMLCLNINGWKPIVLDSWFHMHKEMQLGNMCSSKHSQHCCWEALFVSKLESERHL
jgi:hypothetical protein